MRTASEIAAKDPRRARRSRLSPLAGLLAVAALAWLPLVSPRPAAAQAKHIDVPPPGGFVSDFAGVVEPATRQQLELLIQELKQKTGAEIAVVTLRSTQPETIDDYAMAIAERWKPGVAGKDNGVVFLVATDDRKMHILTGYGVEGPLPDGKVGAIRDQLVVPRHLRRDDGARGRDRERRRGHAHRTAQAHARRTAGDQPVPVAVPAPALLHHHAAHDGSRWSERPAWLRTRSARSGILALRMAARWIRRRLRRWPGRWIRGGFGWQWRLWWIRWIRRRSLRRRRRRRELVK